MSKRHGGGPSRATAQPAYQPPVGHATMSARPPAPAQAQPQPLRIFLGVAVGRSYDTDFFNCLFRLVQRAGHVGIPLRFFPRGNDALIERSRSCIATYFLEETDSEVLLTIDTDVLFDPDDAITICRQAVELNAIVGGVYVTRSREQCIPSSRFFAGDPIEFAGDPTPRPVKYLATGFMAVPRAVFAALATRPDQPLCHASSPRLRLRPFYLPFCEEDEGELLFLSEDWALCARARQEGFACYVNPAVRLMHQGEYGFRLEDMFDHPAPAQPVVITRTSNPAGADSRYAIETYSAPLPAATSTSTSTSTSTETEAVPV